MKISVNWIKEFTDIKLPVDQLVTKIGAQLGEVEEIIDLGERYSGIAVAKVVTVEKHPNADKLQVCLIDDGGVTKSVKRDNDGYVQVVCGAPNVRVGIMVAWIPPGAIVPSSFDGEQFTLESRELRGVVSNGMLASGKELTINDDHDGILVIDKPCQPGDVFSELYYLNDYIIDVENKMFTHRPDCFGQLGVAREIAGITGVSFKSPDWYVKELATQKATRDQQLKLTVDNQLPDLVPRFMAATVAGVKVQKSSILMQSFLSRVGIKPVNNVVDITNFVMALTAQPLHAYDYDKLLAIDGSSEASIVIRKPKKDETILLLNGKMITPNQDSIMIASKKTLIAVGGVMGGKTTEVDFDTKNIVVECANFDMYATRRSSMSNGLFTDGVTRFSKGQSLLQNDVILDYALELLQNIAGGEQAGVIDIVAKKELRQDGIYWAEGVTTSVDFINNRLGSSLSKNQIVGLLTNVEFAVSAQNNGQLVTSIPFWRTDIEIPEDIVEEVGRLYGYDNLATGLPSRTIAPVSVNKLQQTKSDIRTILSSAGANEVLTYSFVDGKLLDVVGQNKDLAFRLSNALSPDLQYYRLSLLPSLLEKIHSNLKAGYSQFSLFEINKTHDQKNTGKDGLPVEEERLALVFVADKKAEKQYNGSAYYLVKYYTEYLMTKFGITDLSFEPISSSAPKTATDQQAVMPFDNFRSAYLKTKDGVVLGVLGEVKQGIKQSLKLPNFIAGLELDVQKICDLQKMSGYIPLSRFPKTQQDISLRVANDVTYSDIQQNIKNSLIKAATEHGYSWQLLPLDIYQKSEAKKHFAFRIIISHPDRTLVTAEVSTLIDEVAKSAQKSFNAEKL